MINTFGVHILKYLNNISIVWHAVGTTAVVIAILTKAPTHQSGSFVFTTFVDQTGVDGVTQEPRKYIPNPNTLLSFFGRLNYSFDDRYLVTLSFRDDASSRFSKQNQWVVFPAASAAWRVNKESFMAGATFLSDLKLRGSYGITGQQDVSGNNPYPYLSTYQKSTTGY